MPYCPHCGRSVREGARFCSRCGERLGTEDDIAELDDGGGETETIQIREIPRPCAFCDATGRDPSGLGVPKRICPVCKGARHNEVPETWPRCKGPCDGKGRILAYRGGIPGIGDVYEPCPICGGTGWAKA